MHDFRQLDVWEESVLVAEAVYRLTSEFPNEERFGLTTQTRRAAVSVSSNIAEGAGRGRSKEMAQFLRIALGSLSELETQIEIACRLGYLSSDQVSELALGALRRRVFKLHD